MGKKVVVIGGGITGMEASVQLSALGYTVTLLEKENQLGGHLKDWTVLFPNLRKGHEIVSFLEHGLQLQEVNVIYNARVKSIQKINKQYEIALDKKINLIADAILVATGFDLFDANKKEEFGYGLYENVITSYDLEKIFAQEGEIKTPSGIKPQRIGFIHCVGSRDEKVNNHYCSNVCCVTGVKQAMELKTLVPDAEIFNFYMDMRMFDTHFEELYLESQKKYGVNFIRGRLSEASETIDKRIMIKVEDTLTSRPLKMTVDMLVLLVGMEPSKGTKEIAKILNLNLRESGFLKPEDDHTLSNVSNMPGVFFAGTCSGPMSIKYTFTDARAAVTKINCYLKEYELQHRILLN